MNRYAPLLLIIKLVTKLVIKLVTTIGLALNSRLELMIIEITGEQFRLFIILSPTREHCSCGHLVGDTVAKDHHTRSRNHLDHSMPEWVKTRVQAI